MDDVATTVEAPTAPPPPASSELAEIKETLARIERGGEYEIPALSDSDSGREKKIYAGAHDSARYLARRRKEEAERAGAAPPELNAEPDLVIGYRDNRLEVSAKEAAKDLAAYRERLAQQLIEGADLGTAAIRASGFDAQQEAVTEQPVEPQPEPTQQQSEQERITRAEVETAAIVNTYRESIGAILMAIRGQGIPPELQAITTPEAWAALQVQDPEKAAQISDYVQRRAAMAQQLEFELGRVRQHQAQMQAMQFQQYGEEQDRLAEELVPELKDEAAYPTLQKAAVDVLEEAGLSRQQMAAAWHGAPIQLRSAAAQKILADAAKWRLAQEKARTAITKPVPPVQRPGVRQPDRTQAQFEADRLSKVLDANRGEGIVGLRTAAQLVAERRRARQ
jgi:hypothetical protein